MLSPPNTGSEIIDMLLQVFYCLIASWKTQLIACSSDDAEKKVFYQDWIQSHFNDSGSLQKSMNAAIDYLGRQKFLY